MENETGIPLQENLPLSEQVRMVSRVVRRLAATLEWYADRLKEFGHDEQHEELRRASCSEPARD